MIRNVSRIMPIQIEIGMVCHVENRILIAPSCILQLQFIIIRQRIGDLQFLIARESHIPISHLQAEGYGILPFLYIPHAFMASQFLMAVKIIRSVIHIQLIFHPVHRKARICNPVGARSDHCAEKSPVFKIFRQRIVPHHHIRAFTILIRHFQAHQNGTVIHHLCLHSLCIC